MFEQHKGAFGDEINTRFKQRTRVRGNSPHAQRVRHGGGRAGSGRRARAGRGCQCGAPRAAACGGIRVCVKSEGKKGGRQGVAESRASGGGWVGCRCGVQTL